MEQTLTLNNDDIFQTVTVTQSNNVQSLAVDQIDNVQDIPVNPDVEFLRGYSPTIDVEMVEGGHYVTITDVEGCKTFFVIDGTEVSSEQIDESVSGYLKEHPVEIDIADDVTEGDPRPVSSAAVHMELGNIDAILKTI